jgi:translation initiation factor eIF-2B subunit epsilon
MGKAKSSSAAHAAADQDNKTEVKFQAVLLCDSFTQTFRPLSLDQPKVLCPLNNVIMMDYALEFLVGAGVEELVVVCGSTLVEDHVLHSYWNSNKSTHRQPASMNTTTTTTTSALKVTVVRDASISNVGDALRELDKRNLIQCDPFILMYGDVITNVDLSGAIAQHQQRHKKDSSAIMTILFHQVGGWNVVPDHSHVGQNDAGEHDHIRRDDDDDDNDDDDGMPREETTRPHYAGGDGHLASLRNTKVLASPLRESKDDLIVGVDPNQDNRILVFDDHSRDKSVAIPCSFWTSHSQIELHTDWMDCGIYLCSPDVLARFSDEFDYTDLPKEFVANSVAEEEEGLQNKLYAHVLRQPYEYAARVHDTYTYAAVSQDLLRRWCYPVVPDRLPVSGDGVPQHRYTCRNFLYRAQQSSSSSQRSSKLGRKSVVQGPGMIGIDCTIEESCHIRSCVIGHGCFVGSHVTLEECHIWDNVRIEDGATVKQSILANDVVVHASATIERGCVIGKGCVVGKGVTLPPFTRLSLVQEAQDDLDFDDFGDSLDDDEVAIGGGNAPARDDEKKEQVEITDHDVVGPDGRGHVWHPTMQDYDEEDDMEDDAEDLIQAQSIGFDRQSFYRERMEQQKEQEDELSDDSDLEDKGHFETYTGGSVTFHEGAHTLSLQHPSSNTTTSARVATPSIGTSAPQAFSSNTAQTIVGRQKGIDVIAELKQICLEHPVNAPYENLAIELNSFKFSQNATYSDCTRAAILAVLELMNITTTTSDKELVLSFKTQLKQWAGPLLRKMCVGLEEETSVVYGLEQAALNNSKPDISLKLSTGFSFRLLLQTLHDEELVSAEAILAWAAACRQDTSTDSRRAKLFQLKPVQQFLEWLETNDDDDDDEDDEDDEEEE